MHQSTKKLSFLHSDIHRLKGMQHFHLPWSNKCICFMTNHNTSHRPYVWPITKPLTHNMYVQEMVCHNRSFKCLSAERDTTNVCVQILTLLVDSMPIVGNCMAGLVGLFVSFVYAIWCMHYNCRGNSESIHRIVMVRMWFSPANSLEWKNRHCIYI